MPFEVGAELGDVTLQLRADIQSSCRELRPALWMSLAVLLMQSFLGRGLHDIREAHLAPWTLAVAAPLSFAWLVIEVGVVEEFFFRALLQERLAAVLRSPWGGLVVAALLFGLVHAWIWKWSPWRPNDGGLILRDIWEAQKNERGRSHV